MTENHFSTFSRTGTPALDNGSYLGGIYYKDQAFAGIVLGYANNAKSVTLGSTAGVSTAAHVVFDGENVIAGSTVLANGEVHEINKTFAKTNAKLYGTYENYSVGTMRANVPNGAQMYFIRVYDEIIGEEQVLQNHFADLCYYYGLAVVIVEGRGRGQYRNVIDEGSPTVHIDRPWDIEPDEDSIFVVTAFNGRHLITDNYFCETGVAVQTYPPNIEAIVARNVSDESGGGFSTQSRFVTTTDNNGKLWYWAEPNILTTTVDNTIVHGGVGISYRASTHFSIGSLQKKGVGARLAFGVTMKRNSAHAFAGFVHTNSTDMTVMEKNLAENAIRAYTFGHSKFRERWEQEDFPTNYVIRDNMAYNAVFNFKVMATESEKVGELK